MEARDFVYNFTDILFSEIARGTILIENWEESDFDYRYAEYAYIFLKMKKGCLDTGCTDEEIFLRLRNSRSTVVKEFNKTMRENFIEEFRRNGSNAAVFDQLLSADTIKADAISANCLELFRGFEERTFTKKPENGV